MSTTNPRPAHATGVRSRLLSLEAKRRAVDDIAIRQSAADEKRKAEATRQQEATVSQLSVVQ